MEINRNARWLLPYVRIAEKHVNKRISKLTLKANPKRVLNPAQGITTKGHGAVVITIHTDYRKVKKKGESLSLIWKPFSKIDTLQALAHELAHLVHWNHSPERMILESRLMIFFMRRLSSTGYRSEEETEGIN